MEMTWTTVKSHSRHAVLVPIIRVHIAKCVRIPSRISQQENTCRNIKASALNVIYFLRHNIPWILQFPRSPSRDLYSSIHRCSFLWLVETMRAGSFCPFRFVRVYWLTHSLSAYLLHIFAEYLLLTVFPFVVCTAMFNHLFVYSIYMIRTRGCLFHFFAQTVFTMIYINIFAFFLSSLISIILDFFTYETSILHFFITSLQFSSFSSSSS